MRINTGKLRSERGSMTVEFVFIGILAMIPLLYLVVAAFDVQRHAFAVSHAAREAGRALSTTHNASEGLARARTAMAMALADQGLDSRGAQLRIGDARTPCDSAPPARVTDVNRRLLPGARFVVCVVKTYVIPGVPSFLDGQRNTVTGRYVVDIGPYREGVR